MIPKVAVFALTALMAVSAAFGWILNNLYTEVRAERLEAKMRRSANSTDEKEVES